MRANAVFNNFRNEEVETSGIVFSFDKVRNEELLRDRIIAKNEHGIVECFIFVGFFFFL